MRRAPTRPRRGQPSRRVPRQERAQATVDVLLEAAARVFVEAGFERATTKRIAEVAGVSIGSLYQYFPSKEALMVELGNQQTQQILDRMVEIAKATQHETIESVARLLVAAFVETYREHPTLYRVTVEASQRLGPAEGVPPAVRRFESMVNARLARHRDEIRPSDLDLATFVLLRAVRAVVWSALTERPESLDDPALIEELTVLVLGFLRR